MAFPKSFQAGDARPVTNRTTINSIASDNSGNAIYTVGPIDSNTVIISTAGYLNVVLGSALALGSGFSCWIWNTAANPNTVTIKTTASELIDGIDPSTTFKLTQNSGVRIVCNGTSFYTTDHKVSGSSAAGVLATQIGRSSTGLHSIAIAAGATAIGSSYASGTDSFAAGGGTNSSSYGAQGANSCTVGFGAKATNSFAAALGGGTASGQYSITVGGSIASATRSLGMGMASKAAQSGKLAYAAYSVVTGGDAQFGLLVLVASTTGTLVILTSDQGAADTTNQLIVASNQVMAFTGTIIGKQTGSANIAAYTITGTIVNNAGTVTMPTGTVTAIGTPTAGWTAPTLAADNTNKGLTVNSGYNAATNIRWVCEIKTSELTYA